MPEGRVLRIDAKCAHVSVDGATLQLPLRGRLFESQGLAKRPLAVGDVVTVNATLDAIDAVLPRQSQLSRRASGENEREQVIAANVTLLLVVMPVRDPNFDPLLVDRMFAAAEREGLRAVLVVSKLDRDKHQQADEWLTLYRELGYEVHATCTLPEHETKDSLAVLAQLLHENTTVLCGPSGAGKSSLINRLVPGVTLRVGALGKLKQGQHTTTSTQLVPLPGGGFVLDTPGVRSFALWSVGTQELGFYFRDIKARSSQCAYRNCSHRTEPDCAVREHVAPSRLRSYLTLFDEATRAR